MAMSGGLDHESLAWHPYGPGPLLPLKQSIEFGYYPRPIDFQSGDLRVETLPDLDQTVADVSADGSVEKDWIYAPAAGARDFMTGKVTKHPYSARVFGLPKTHKLEHANADGEEHLSFLIWVLGFIHGIRLTETEAGFLDATPIKPGKLHDIVLTVSDTERKAVEHAERFWRTHSSNSRVPKALTAIIHALFLAQFPPALSFERFTYLYVALDGCHFVHSTLQGTAKNRVTHAERIEALCKAFGIAVPTWADPNAPGNIASNRNETLHEGLFFDEPLGFSVYGGNKKAAAAGRGNTVLEMQKLVCRLLCALLDLPDKTYVRSPVNDRQMHGMKL